MTWRLRPADLRLCLITDTQLCGERGVAAVVDRAVAGGVTMVQVRAKGTPDRERLELVRAVQHVVSGRVPVIVDDCVDVALLAGADGVHLGQSDLPADEVRRMVGTDLLIGVSVSMPSEVRTVGAARAADYLGIGPVWATPTKCDAADPIGSAGLAAVAAVAAGTGLPTVAIGGIHADNLAGLRHSGVDGVCTVSEICTADRPDAAAAALRRIWDEEARG